MSFLFNLCVGIGNFIRYCSCPRAFSTKIGQVNKDFPSKAVAYGLP